MLSTGRMHDTFRRTDQLENRVAQLFNFRLVNPEFLFESKTWEITFIRQEVTLKWLKMNNGNEIEDIFPRRLLPISH